MCALRGTGEEEGVLSPGVSLLTGFGWFGGWDGEGGCVWCVFMHWEEIFTHNFRIKERTS